MLKNDTLKNGTSRTGLYGSAPPLGFFYLRSIYLSLSKVETSFRFTRFVNITSLDHLRSKLNTFGSLKVTVQALTQGIHSRFVCIFLRDLSLGV